MTDQISAQEFLRESSLFSLNFSGFTVGFEAKIKDDYSFYIPNFFSRYARGGEKEMENDFEETLRSFIVNYLIEWFKYIKTQKGGIDNESDFLRKLSRVTQDIRSSKMFTEVVFKKERATFQVTANKSFFDIMRFGDCLGMKLNGEHKGGAVALEALMANRDNMFCPQLFMESISSWIPLEGRNDENGNDKIVDFSHMIDQLRTSLPEITFGMKGEMAEGIVDAYKGGGKKDFCIGDYCGVPVHARITHGENLNKTDIRSADYYSNDVRIWREGNVQSLQNLEYRFKDAQGLAFVLSVRNSLPSPFSINSIDDQFENHEEQWRMKAVASMINTQLPLHDDALFYRFTKKAEVNFKETTKSGVSLLVVLI